MHLDPRALSTIPLHFPKDKRGIEGDFPFTQSTSSVSSSGVENLRYPDPAKSSFLHQTRETGHSFLAFD